MLTPVERARIHRWACLPEQVPEYVEAISNAESFLFGDFAGYLAGGVLVFVGYPLEGAFDEDALKREVDAAVEKLRPERLSLMAPSRPGWVDAATHAASDRYFRLELEGFSPRGKLLYTIRRAARELSVAVDSRIGEDHRRLIEAFGSNRALASGTREVFSGIPRYADSVESCRIVSAREGSGRLEAFSVGELGARDVAFHMFNFRAPDTRVPGASDLLLFHLAEMARERGKTHLNLGLGIHGGVEFFKRKWGATPFADYHHFVIPVSRRSPWKSLLHALAAPFR